jgi:hypothetical protein
VSSFAGLLALQLERRHILLVSQITGLSRMTIYRGLHEIERSDPKRAVCACTGRRSHCGRKKQPGIFAAIEQLLEDATAGDPITG